MAGPVNARRGGSQALRGKKSADLPPWLAIRALTPELWPALEDLFGRHGASNGCWCMYWRIGSAYRERPREENRAELHSIVRRGYRERGVSAALLAAAIRFAREAGAPALEAYPSRSDPKWYTGLVSTLARAGFREAGGSNEDRPVMRRELRGNSVRRKRRSPSS